MNSKKCGKCQTVKPIDEFYKNRSRSDGLQYQCKPCNRLVSKKYRADNPDKQREYNRKWLKANPYKQREYSRKWREANTERFNAYHREYQAALRAADPLYFRLKFGFERARKAGVEAVPFTSGELKEHWASVGVDADTCAYCGEQLGDGWHIDHAVPISRGGGHTLENVAPSCPGCNHAKGEKTADEFLSAATVSSTSQREGGS